MTIVNLVVPVTGVILSDQVKSLDWRVRKAERKGKASAAALAEVRAKLRAVIGG